MRDTASETLALPFEESASSFSYPITNNSSPIGVYSRSFAVQSLLLKPPQSRSCIKPHHAAL